ncbi:MFS transporter [Labrys neptuniae]|uniref:MFS transporter n=1 Tax=Labrys neptuniae TaxID=376174 RepID=UPI00288C8B4D|nr:MFS transporter [Labrys neptuniae]MDT3379470.1 MFS transporter [Labrys neptuniae]
MRPSSAPFLFAGTMLAAAGYGATFLLASYYRAHGGGDIETGLTLGAAMVGTFTGVPLVGWLSGRFDAARMCVAACCAVAAGFLLLAASAAQSGFTPGLASGFLIGLGWGMFYIAAPMALSERITDADRAFWFMRFAAFQMAGIGGGPVLLNLSIHQAGLSIEAAFLLVGLACLAASALLWIFGTLAPGEPRIVALRPWLRDIAVIGRGASIRPIIMVALGACVFSGLMTFQSTLVRDTAANEATFFAVYAVTVVAARLLLARTLAGLPQVALATGLLAAMVLGVLAMLGVTLHPAFQILAAILTGIGYGLVYPVIQTWAVNDTPRELRHAALTWFVLSYFIGVFGFPVIGGWMLVNFGKSTFLVVLLGLALAELLIAVNIGFARKRSIALGTGRTSAS